MTEKQKLFVSVWQDEQYLYVCRDEQMYIVLAWRLTETCICKAMAG